MSALWRRRGLATAFRLEFAACDRQVSVTAGTIFQGTHTPLRVWFRTM